MKKIKNRLMCVALIIMCFIIKPVEAQVFEGTIIDESGEPVLYATLYIEETREGCTTNDKGFFSMPLKSGHYTVHIQHISYITETKNITIPLSQPLQITLQLKNIMLNEAVVTPKDEDPAYTIMRRAIAKAPYHRKQIQSYHAENYGKATLFIDHIPNSIKRLANFAGEDFSLKSGDVYTYESISRISFEHDSLFQHILSVKSSFPKEIELGYNTDEFNVFDIYGKTGNFISPLSPQALSAYRFRLESTSFNEHGKMIFHIKLSPKNNNPFAFSGYVDIIDESWHVHYFDLSASAKINIIKTSFNIKQSFAELEKNIWTPISYYLKQQIEAMGIKVRINLSASRQYIDYLLNLNNYFSSSSEIPSDISSTVTPVKISEKSKRIEQKMTQMFQKEEISNRDALKIISLIDQKTKEDAKNNPEEGRKTLELKSNHFLTIDSLAFKRDSSYWSINRKMPLSEAEQQSYVIRERSDSLKKGHIQKEGSNSSFSYRSLHFGFDKFEEFISFNAVDGFKLRFGGYIDKTFKDSTILQNKMMLGYSFLTKHAIGSFLSKYVYLPEKRASFTLFGGKESSDFNLRSNNVLFANTLSSLFFKENMINLYDRTYGGIQHSIEAFNGLDVNIEFLYEWRKQLHNQTEYAFFYRNSKKYHPNEPKFIAEHFLQNNEAAIFQLRLNYTPQRYYYFDRRYKRISRSEYPTISFLWKKAIPNIAGSNTEFDYIELGIGQEVKMGILKKIRYNVYSGWFPKKGKMHFSEFRHFDAYGFQLMFNDFYRIYHTLKPYTPSTNEWMISGFIKFETPYLCLKFIPGLNNTLISENLYLSYLNTPVLKHYIETGYSLSNIWMIAHIGVFVGFENFKYSSVNLKLSVNIPKL